MTDQTRAEMLKGVSERRSISEFELRDAGNGLLHFNGYAAVWDQTYEVADFFGTFTESVERNALQRTLSRNPDVVLNINHGGLPLARTTSGSLRIGTDKHGYQVEADLEPRDPDVESIRYKLERGDMTDMSWAFRVTVDEWTVHEDGTESRVIKEVNVDGGDVSIVNTGANRQTEAHLRAIDSLAGDLVEVRAELGDIDLDKIRLAHTNLGTLLSERSPRKTLSLRAAERALELD